MRTTISKVIVLGGGSAGFLSAIALKSKLPHLDVTVIRSKDIGIIGVGEGSTVGLTDFLHRYLNIPARQFFQIAQPVWKLGLRFVWGPRPYFNYTFNPLQLDGIPSGLRRVKGFYCDDVMEYEDPVSAMMTHDRVFPPRAGGGPALHWNFAYHFENEKFVRFLEGYAQGLGVPVLDETVQGVEQSDAGVEALRLAGGRSETADLFVDASGFASVLLGKTLGLPFVTYQDSLFCDRAVVGGWNRTDEPIHPYTTCETMDGGWCWQIEHETRINRGYVYCSAFVSDEQAEREFRSANPKLGPTRIVKFRSGRHEQCWVKNVVAIGNASGFVEPLEATALGAIAQQSRTLADLLIDSDRHVTDSARRHYNLYHARYWDSIRNFLAVHYRFNTRLQTPFWKECLEETKLAGAEEVVAIYRENGPTFLFGATLFTPADQFGPAGYVAMLLGQKVPHQAAYQPDASELQAWQSFRELQKQFALGAMTVPQTLAAIHAPNWSWDKR